MTRRRRLYRGCPSPSPAPREQTYQISGTHPFTAIIIKLELIGAFLHVDQDHELPRHLLWLHDDAPLRRCLRTLLLFLPLQPPPPPPIPSTMRASRYVAIDNSSRANWDAAPSGYTRAKVRGRIYLALTTFYWTCDDRTMMFTMSSLPAAMPSSSRVANHKPYIRMQSTCLHPY
jgi:hypothetical protein